MNYQPDLRPLTDRQRQVAALLLDGFSNKQMADELSISESTIKQHLIDLRNKFGADNRTRLAVILVQLRMVNRNRFENGDAPDL